MLHGKIGGNHFKTFNIFLYLDLIGCPRSGRPAVLVVDIAQALEQPHHHDGDEQLAESEEGGDGLPLGAQTVHKRGSEQEITGGKE